MRWKGIIFLVALAALFFILSLIFTDTWLENRMEAVGSAVVGAKVEFDDVRFKIIGLNIGWEHMQVTDPQDTWTNMFETGACRFDLEFEPLLSKKYVIEDFSVLGLKFATRRETDGKLARADKDENKYTQMFVDVIKEQIEKETRDMPVFNLGQLTRKVNVDSIYAMIDLQTPGKVDSAKKVVEQKIAGWEKRIDTLPDAATMDKFGKDISALNPQNINDLEKLRAALENAKKIRDQLRRHKENFSTIKSDLDGEIKDVRETTKQVSRWIEQDFQRVLRLAKLPEINVQNVARLLFGRQLFDRLDQVTGYVGTARYYAEQYQAATASSKPESPPRLEGEYIHFGKQKVLPKFWIKKVALSGETKTALQLSGTAENIVSNQRLIDRPMTIEMGGTRSDQAGLSFSGTFDYRGETHIEDLALNLKQVPMTDIKLTDFALFPPKIEAINASVDARLRFEGSELQGSVDFSGRNVSFAPRGEAAQKLNPRLLRISESITGAIKEISFGAALRQAGGKLDVKLSSNLDKLIAGELKKALSGEVEQARKELEARVKEETEKYKAQFDTFVAEKTAVVNEQLAKIGVQIDTQNKRIDQVLKDLENEIEQRVKDSAKDKLKDLFKKPE